MGGRVGGSGWTRNTVIILESMIIRDLIVGVRGIPVVLPVVIITLVSMFYDPSEGASSTIVLLIKVIKSLGQ